MLAGALVRSIRSESNRESQVVVEAGSGRLRPSPSPFSSLSFTIASPCSSSSPLLQLTRACPALPPLVSSLSRCRSLNRSSSSCVCALTLSLSLTLSIAHGPTGYIFPALSSFARLFLPLFLPSACFNLQPSCFSLSDAANQSSLLSLSLSIRFRFVVASANDPSRPIDRAGTPRPCFPLRSKLFHACARWIHAPLRTHPPQPVEHPLGRVDRAYGEPGN